MPEEKVYTQQVIEDNPFPNEEQASQSDSSSSTSQTYTPKTIKDTPVRKPIIATETIGQALNTKSKKILGDFQFTESGALSIGKYTNGVSGDVKISPNGVVARNSSGNTTFALDGDTGNATFSGTVQAGDVTVMDELGLVSLSNFSSSSSASGGANQSITSVDPNWTDITGTELKFSLKRSANVLTMNNVSYFAVKDTATSTTVKIRVVIDDEPRAYPIYNTDVYSMTSSSFTRVGVLGMGDHTLKLQGTLIVVGGGSPSLTIYSYSIYYLILGS